MTEEQKPEPNAYEPPQDPTTSAPTKTWRSKIPPLAVRILLAVIFLAIIVLRTTGVLGDFAMTNVFTFLGLLLAGVVFLRRRSA